MFLGTQTKALKRPNAPIINLIFWGNPQSIYHLSFTSGKPLIVYFVIYGFAGKTFQYKSFPYMASAKLTAPVNVVQRENALK